MKNQHPTKLRVLNAARHEFAAFGLAGARVDRIARTAGVNKAMIYYYFSSKEDLYQAVLDDLVSNTIGRLTENLPPDPDLEALLTVIARNYRRVLSDRKVFLQVMLRELADSGGALKTTIIRAVGEQGLKETIDRVIRKERRRGRLRRVDIRHAIASFLGMNIWYLIIAPVFNAVWEIDDAQKFIDQRDKAVVDLFLKGILGR